MTVNTLAVCIVIFMNAAAFLLYGIDKWKAVHDRWRISEAALLGIALCGGAAGAYAGMYTFHHKTKKPKFYIGVPLILVLWIVIAGIVIKYII